MARLLGERVRKLSSPRRGAKPRGRMSRPERRFGDRAHTTCRSRQRRGGSNGVGASVAWSRLCLGIESDINSTYFHALVLVRGFICHDRRATGSSELPTHANPLETRTLGFAQILMGQASKPVRCTSSKRSSDKEPCGLSFLAKRAMARRDTPVPPKFGVPIGRRCTHCSLHRHCTPRLHRTFAICTRRGASRATREPTRQTVSYDSPPMALELLNFLHVYPSTRRFNFKALFNFTIQLHFTQYLHELK